MSKTVPKKINRPSTLTIDIAGELTILGISNINDAFDMYDILTNNGYHVTLSPVAENQKEKTDE